MRTGIFGGTFNPVHNGHLHLANAYLSALSLDRLLVVPTYRPPHKVSVDLADGADRLEMCRLAFAGMERCLVSDIELRRAKKSYSVDTLEELRTQYPQDEFYLLMGSDMFLTLTEWYHWERIFQLATVCVGAREPGLTELLEEYGRHLETLGAYWQIVNLDPMRISSTQVRKTAQAKGDILGLVPEAVAFYIAEHKLYQGAV